MAQYDKNQPSYCNQAHREMAPAWEIMADTCGGTLKLREKSAQYLPKEPAEQPDPYNYRLRRATFFNAVELTLGGLVGMVFRNDPKLSENVPETIRGREAVAAKPATEGQSAVEAQDGVEGHWENIDNAGTHGVVFAKELFTDAMKDGHAAILVDMPPPLSEGATMADEQAAGRRPYWVSYCAEQIINWRTQVVNGQTKLSLIVFKEKTKEPDGEFGEQDVIRYRVFYPGFWQLYKEVKGENLQTQIILDPDTPGGEAPQEIPVAVVYSRKTGILTSQPPMLDLALTNITHYQKYSDYSVYLHIASRPILSRKGADPSKPITAIGPYTIFDVSPDGDVWFAETTGAALGGAREDIKDLEERMSILGLSLLVKRTGPQVTATEEKGDRIEESSDLATAARSLKDGIELALKFHTQYLNPKADTGGNIELGAALDELEMTPQEMTAWSNAVVAGQFSVETLWSVFEVGGKLPSDFDPREERKRIDAEAQKKADLADQALTVFERGGPAE